MWSELGGASLLQTQLRQRGQGRLLLHRRRSLSSYMGAAGGLGWMGWSFLVAFHILFVHGGAASTWEKAEEIPAGFEPGRTMGRDGQLEAFRTGDRPVSNPAEAPRGGEASEAPASSVRRLAKHRSGDSAAGGEVIIGGLLTAIFAAVICYIRVTRRRHSAVASHHS